MGLFGKLFEKKECSVCGGEIGLLGNRKLEDGNLCKSCAAKLSPWFSDRRQSTVEEIKEQLDYREANREKVAAFRTTRTLGERTKVLLDEDAGLFMVTAARDLEEANPDVLSFSDVTGCKLDIDESKTEIEYRDAEGERQKRREARRRADGAEGDGPVTTLVHKRDETQDRGDHKARTEPHEHAAAPDEDRHARRRRENDLAYRAEQDAAAEGPLPPDDGAGKAAGDHKGAPYERIDHVCQLYLRRRGAELAREGGCGKRKGAVIARGTHLGENQNENGKYEEPPRVCGLGGPCRLSRLHGG